MGPRAGSPNAARPRSRAIAIFRHPCSSHQALYLSWMRPPGQDCVRRHAYWRHLHRDQPQREDTPTQVRSILVPQLLHCLLPATTTTECYLLPSRNQISDSMPDAWVAVMEERLKLPVRRNFSDSNVLTTHLPRTRQRRRHAHGCCPSQGTRPPRRSRTSTPRDARSFGSLKGPKSRWGCAYFRWVATALTCKTDPAGDPRGCDITK